MDAPVSAIKVGDKVRIAYNYHPEEFAGQIGTVIDVKRASYHYAKRAYVKVGDEKAVMVAIAYLVKVNE